VHYERLAGVLAEFAQVLLTDYEVVDILDRLCARVPEVLPVSGAGVVLMDSGELFLGHASNHQVGRVEQMQDAMGEGPCRDAVSTRRLVLAHDLDDEPRWPEFAAYARQQGLRGVAALPMSARGVIRGVLDVYSEQPLRLSSEQLPAAGA
jgi:putative methionine-R-sulfoxide reductase with GAF domain